MTYYLPFPRIGPFDPPPWVRALHEVTAAAYLAAAARLDPDEVGNAVALEPLRCYGYPVSSARMLDGMSERELRRLKFYQWLHQVGRLHDGA